MKIQYHKSIIALLFAISFCISNAQIPEAAKSMLSPNAAALGEYGEVPVSYFTGIPQIAVPLYTLQCGSHSFPISLSYHAGGVRPDQHPGWVGLGWSLQAGGCISRVVKDSIDEYSNPVALLASDSNEFFQRESLGHFWSAINSATNENELARVMQSAVESGHFSYAIDYEADEFRFDFLDYHGKFYRDNEGWRIQCDRAVKIAPIDSMEFINPYIDLHTTLPGENSSPLKSNIRDFGRSNAIRGFTLIAEDGTRYEFGGDLSAIEYSVPFWGQKHCGLTATAWHLTRITYTDGRIVNLKYDRSGFCMQHAISKYASLNSTFGREFTLGGFEYLMAGGEIHNDRNCYAGHLIRPSYLTSISTDDAEVSFERIESRELEYNLFDIMCDHFKSEFPDLSDLDNIGKPNDILPLLVYNCDPNFDYQNVTSYNILSERMMCGQDVNVKEEMHLDSLLFMKMNKMNITSKITGDTIKTFELHFNNDKGPVNQRLFLNGISEISSGVSGKQWKFSYVSPDSLPPYLANKIDHWGYYNGRKGVFSQISSYRAQREPVASCLQFGSLHQIDHPTGGHTRFFYEPHTYSRKVAVTRDSLIEVGDTIAGGLRIRKIETWADEGSDTIVHNFYYLKGYSPNKSTTSLSSSGILGGDVCYEYHNYRPGLQYNVTENNSPFPHSGMSFSLFSSQSILPGTENACGVHVGYSEVADVTNDGACTVYYYTNFDDGHFDSLCDVSLQSYTHRYFEPYNERSFNRGLLKEERQYELEHGSWSPRIYRTVSYELDDSTSSNYMRNFRIKTFFPFGRRDVNNIAYAECTAYRHYLCTPRKIQETTSVQEFESTLENDTVCYSYLEYNKLPVRISKTTGNGGYEITTNTYVSETAFPQLYNQHILTPLVEQRIIRAENGMIDTVSVINNFYSEHNLAPFPIVVSKRRGQCLSEEGSVTNYIYDSYNNPLEETVNDFIKTVYIWGYRAKYIVAVIQNATLQDVLSELGVTDINAFEFADEPDFAALDRLRYANRMSGASVTTYRYSPLVGVSEITMPNGKKMTYSYDQFGRLQAVKDDSNNILEYYQYNYGNKGNN